MIKAGYYKHYKGNLYFVAGVSKHSETLEDLVIYWKVPEAFGEFGELSHLHPDLWARPLSMFLENVEVDGKTVPRFALVSEAHGE